ncbi:MAG: hypothetical protein ACYCVB_01020 [Bacilli bacterium]
MTAWQIYKWGLPRVLAVAERRQLVYASYAGRVGLADGGRLGRVVTDW